MFFFALPVYMLAAGFMLLSSLRFARVAVLRWRGQPHGEYDIEFAAANLLVAILLQSMAHAVATA